MTNTYLIMHIKQQLQKFGPAPLTWNFPLQKYKVTAFLLAQHENPLMLPQFALGNLSILSNSLPTQKIQNQNCRNPLFTKF